MISQATAICNPLSSIIPIPSVWELLPWILWDALICLYISCNSLFNLKLFHHWGSFELRHCPVYSAWKWTSGFSLCSVMLSLIQAAHARAPTGFGKSLASCVALCASTDQPYHAVTNGSSLTREDVVVASAPIKLSPASQCCWSANMLRKIFLLITQAPWVLPLPCLFAVRLHRKGWYLQLSPLSCLLCNPGPDWVLQTQQTQVPLSVASF